MQKKIDWCYTHTHPHPHPHIPPRECRRTVLSVCGKSGGRGGCGQYQCSCIICGENMLVYIHVCACEFVGVRSRAATNMRVRMNEDMCEREAGVCESLRECVPRTKSEDEFVCECEWHGSVELRANTDVCVWVWVVWERMCVCARVEICVCVCVWVCV